MKSFHEKYGSLFLWWSKTGTGDYRQQPGTSSITFTDYEMKMVTESYYLLDELQSLRLDFMKSPAKPTGMKDLKHTYQMIFDVPGQDQS
ncbi:hypothetical protein ACFTAO_47515 [Paenibacillus rhizoplanae]